MGTTQKEDENDKMLQTGPFPFLISHKYQLLTKGRWKS
jgi:hypothetical protein